MQPLNLSTADDKIYEDVRRYVIDVRRIADSTFESVADGVRILGDLRRTSYEDLNQIQHEYASLRAVRWLIDEKRIAEKATWQWNPRQTGNASEPDIRAVLDDEIIVSAEVTTSPAPNGILDTRMSKTLKKLSTMPGKRFYFVFTHSMARRAKTKANKAGYNLEVINLDHELTGPGTA